MQFCVTSFLASDCLPWNYPIYFSFRSLSTSVFPWRQLMKQAYPVERPQVWLGGSNVSKSLWKLAAIWLTFYFPQSGCFKNCSANRLQMKGDDLADQDGGHHGRTWHCPQKSLLLLQMLEQRIVLKTTMYVNLQSGLWFCCKLRQLGHSFAFQGHVV